MNDQAPENDLEHNTNDNANDNTKDNTEPMLPAARRTIPPAAPMLQVPVARRRRSSSHDGGGSDDEAGVRDTMAAVNQVLTDLGDNIYGLTINEILERTRAEMGAREIPENVRNARRRTPSF